jgi:hypothetical protein
MKTRWILGVAAAIGAAAPVAAQGTSAPGSAVPPRNLALIGVTQVGDLSKAWLVDLDTNRRETAGPGGLAFGYRVKQVGADRVILTRSGRQFVLKLGDRNVPVREAPVVRTPPLLRVAPIAIPESVVPTRDPESGTFPDVTAPPLPEESIAPPPEPVRREAPVEPEPVPEPTPRGYAYVPGYGYVPVTSPYDPTLGGYAFPEYGYPYGFPATPAYGYPYGFPVEPSYPPLYGAPSAPLPVFSRYPAIRSNPQTGRRRSGSYFGSGPATNPQTLRRRGQFGAPR